MTISVRFVWGSEGVPFTFSPEQDSCKRKWGTGDTIGMIRKLKYFLGMNKKGILEKRRNPKQRRGFFMPDSKKKRYPKKKWVSASVGGGF